MMMGCTCPTEKRGLKVPEDNSWIALATRHLAEEAPTRRMESNETLVTINVTNTLKRNKRNVIHEQKIGISFSG